MGRLLLKSHGVSNAGSDNIITESNSLGMLDCRYKQAVGKFVVHPLNKRRIPIVADSVLVDMEFGTGAVKITPAHDPNDFDTGKRHSLEFISILTDDGKINHQGGQFEGQPRFQVAESANAFKISALRSRYALLTSILRLRSAHSLQKRNEFLSLQARVAVVEWLKELGLFRGTAGNEMRLGRCSRSTDVIEPVIKPQWWVDCREMGNAAAAAVHDGSLTVLPSPKGLLM